MDEPIKFEWCIGEYFGEAAQHVLGLANTGTGYYIRRTEGSGKGLKVEAAFRRAIDGPTPEHLQVADPIASQKLDRMHTARHSTARHDQPVQRAKDSTVKHIRETLVKHNHNGV